MTYDSRPKFLGRNEHPLGTSKSSRFNIPPRGGQGICLFEVELMGVRIGTQERGRKRQVWRGFSRGSEKRVFN